MRLLLTIFIIVTLCIGFTRVLLYNPRSYWYMLKDAFLYIKEKRWRVPKTGELVCYCGLFGKGKTLSAVEHITRIYHKYNGLKVWTKDGWKMQYVYVLSNVDLSIPYEKLASLEQIIRYTTGEKPPIESEGVVFRYIALIDEASVQLNNRNFKSNIDASLLNSILTCRHHSLSIILTSQRFHLMDAMLRSVTQDVIQCNKVWRIMCQSVYDAWDLEQAQTPALVKPKRRRYWLVCDKHFNAYDTLACVDNFRTGYKNGEFLSEDEIIKLQTASVQTDIKNVTKLSRRAKKRIH